MTDAFSQSKYQLRFDWGPAGARAIVPGAHVVVLVDALLATTAAVRAAEEGETAGAAGLRPIIDVAADARVLAGSFRNRRAVARRILEMQEERGERVLVAVVAAGGSWPDGTVRFALEDQLAAGAVIDALIELGIDHTSPEAAVASAAFGGLRNASTHIVSASGGAQELIAEGRRDEVVLAAKRDVTELVPEWRDGAFRAG